jgi:RNA polymerase sigma factor (sigma-70 family)
MPRGRKRVPLRAPEEAWALAEANSGLVYSILFKFVNSHDNLVWYKGDDLQAELESFAWEGLYEACLLWDESKGKLSTYAYPSITNSILQALDKLIRMGGNQKGGAQIPLKYKTPPPVFSLDALSEAQVREHDMDHITTLMDELPQPWQDTELEEDKIIAGLDKERLVKKIYELTEKMPEPHRSVFKLMALGPERKSDYAHYIRYPSMGLRETGEILHLPDKKVKKIYEEAVEWMENQLAAINYKMEEDDG